MMTKKEFLKKELTCKTFSKFVEGRLYMNDIPFPTVYDSYDPFIFKTIKHVNDTMYGIYIGRMEYRGRGYSIVDACTGPFENDPNRVFCYESEELPIEKFDGKYCFVTYTETKKGRRATKVMSLRDFGKNNPEGDDMLYSIFTHFLEESKSEKEEDFEKMVMKAKIVQLEEELKNRGKLINTLVSEASTMIDIVEKYDSFIPVKIPNGGVSMTKGTKNNIIDSCYRRNSKTKPSNNEDLKSVIDSCEEWKEMNKGFFNIDYDEMFELNGKNRKLDSIHKDK